MQTWNALSKARAEGSLFSKLKWPKDPELVRPNLSSIASPSQMIFVINCCLSLRMTTLQC